MLITKFVKNINLIGQYKQGNIIKVKYLELEKKLGKLLIAPNLKWKDIDLKILPQ